MSSFAQQGGGSDSVIDLYINSLYVLKEKVGCLLQKYHMTILQKIDCDLGNIVTCNTDNFQSQLADVFTHLNEVEVQLSGLEAWAGLPPECFSSTPSVSQSLAPDVDQASSEAQALVELVHRLKSTLRSLSSKPTAGAPDPATATTTTSALTRDNQTPSKRVPVQSTTGSGIGLSGFPVGPNAPSEVEPGRHMELSVNPNEYGPQSTALDELSLTPHAQRYAYNSPGSVPINFIPSHSPASGGEKRYSEATDMNRPMYRTSQPGMMPYPSGPGGNYPPMSSSSNPSPGVPGSSYLSAELHSQTHIPSSKMGYADPNTGVSSMRNTYSGYPAQNPNPDPFGGPYN